MVSQPRPSAPPPLERRTPGDTDLRIFTTEMLPAGRHRFSPAPSRLRTVYDRSSSRMSLLPPGGVPLLRPVRSKVVPPPLRLGPGW